MKDIGYMIIMVMSVLVIVVAVSFMIYRFNFIMALDLPTNIKWLLFLR